MPQFEIINRESLQGSNKNIYLIIECNPVNPQKTLFFIPKKACHFRMQGTVPKTWHDFCPELQVDSCCHGAISSRCVGWLGLRLPHEQIGWFFGRSSAVMLSVWCLSGPFQGPQTNCNACWLASQCWRAVWKDHHYNHSKQSKSQRSRSSPVSDQSRPSWPASKQLQSKFKSN